VTLFSFVWLSFQKQKPDMGRLHLWCNRLRLLATSSMTNKQNNNAIHNDYIESNHDYICLETFSGRKNPFAWFHISSLYFHTTYNMNECNKWNCQCGRIKHRKKLKSQIIHWDVCADNQWRTRSLSQSENSWKKPTGHCEGPTRQQWEMMVDPYVYGYILQP